MDDTQTSGQTPPEPQTPPTETPESDGGGTTQSHALVEVMHGVILSAILMVSTYLIGVTYWAVSYGSF
jgi:hypothetical protein